MIKVEIYSDVVCPWCYIGERRFERALGAFPGAGAVEVVYRPFQLDPTTPEQAAPTREYLARRFGPRAEAMIAQVTEVARGEGITMDYDRSLVVNTLPAHRLMRLAEREHGAGVQREVAAGLFRAHFSEGADVADLDTLVEVAAAAGMSRERVRAYLESDQGETEVRAEIEHAQRMGVTAVPTFVFEGKYAVQGAQSAAVFLNALETVAQEAGATSADGLCEGDSCAV